MTTPEQDLIDAVTADDSARVTQLLKDDPALVSARDRDGVSVLMLSRYRFDRATTDALLAVDPDLDVFEATALGYLDRLRERLDEDPSRATAFSPDGFTALHFAAFFGKAEVARALRVARSVETGVLSVNSSRSVFVEAPFGGVKQSGLGRELGMAALEAYSELKSVFFSEE